MAYRVVGNILNKNRDPRVPCHRVVRSDGDTGGFAWGRKKKIIMLKCEGAIRFRGHYRGAFRDPHFCEAGKKSYGAGEFVFGGVLGWPLGGHRAAFERQHRLTGFCERFRDRRRMVL